MNAVKRFHRRVLSDECDARMARLMIYEKYGGGRSILCSVGGKDFNVVNPCEGALKYVRRALGRGNEAGHVSDRVAFDFVKAYCNQGLHVGGDYVGFDEESAQIAFCSSLIKFVEQNKR
jgi:hypothetical protein